MDSKYEEVELAPLASPSSASALLVKIDSSNEEEVTLATPGLIPQDIEPVKEDELPYDNRRERNTKFLILCTSRILSHVCARAVLLVVIQHRASSFTS